MENSNAEKQMWSYLQKIKTGMLITHDEAVGIRARPMQLVQDEYSGHLYFFSKLDKKKRKMYSDGKAVGLTFSDPKSNIYVSLSGKARISKDKELIEKFWSQTVQAWLPEGKDAENVALIDIQVENGEYWDSTNNPIRYELEMYKARVTKDTPNLGENQKF